MRRGLRWAGMLLAIVLVHSGTKAVGQQTGDKPDKAEKDKKQAADKLVSAGSMTGKVTDWDKDGGLVTLDVKLSVSDGIDEGAAEAIANKTAELAAAQVKYVNPRDANAINGRLKQIANLQKDIATNQAKLYKFKDVNQKFVVHIADKAVFRLMELPPVFDEKGNVVKRTPAEMKELRGDTRYPGYKGEIGDLKTDLMIKVVIARSKSGKSDTPADKSEKKPDKPDTSDEPKPIKLDRSYQATVVVIGTSDDVKK